MEAEVEIEEGGRRRSTGETNSAKRRKKARKVPAQILGSEAVSKQLKPTEEGRELIVLGAAKKQRERERRERVKGETKRWEKREKEIGD